MSKLKILVVEDDPNLGNLLAEYLNAKGYDATRAENGKEGLRAYKQGYFDFLILDVMMPVKDGFTLAKEIRLIDSEIPILFLSAKSMKDDVFEGFRSGGDDYLTKPFSMEELLMRMDAILRRTRGKGSNDPEKTVHELGSFVFDSNQRTLVQGDTKSKLTSKESELLRLLIESGDGIMDRGRALVEVWGEESYFTARTMDVYIAKLRKHLKADPNLEIINVHGKGFKLLKG